MRRIIGSLRGRIVLASALAALVGLVAVGGLVLAGSRRDERSALDGRLQQRAQQLMRPARQVLNGRRTGVLVTPLGGALLQLGDTGVRIVEAGRVIEQVGSQPTGTLPLPLAAGLRTARATDGARWRAATVAIRGRPGAFVEVSSDLRAVGDSFERLRRRIVLIGLLGLLLSVALASALAGYAVRSLERLRATAHRVAETERLDLRVPLDGPDEVDAVAGALNVMLARLERSTADRQHALQATRRFAADAGHELRVPLAVLQTSLETLDRHPELPEAERAAIVADSLAEHERLSALVVALQALTRGEAGAMGDEREVDLAELLEQSIRAVRRDHPAVAITIDADPGLPAVVGSPTGLRLLSDNLLQNAARHGATGGVATIRVALHRDPAAGPHSGLSLVVEDDGPGIPPADRGRVLERFVRGQGAQADGSGLGLAIVAQQVERLGGRLTIGASPSGGARLAVVFPFEGPADATPQSAR